MVFGRLFGKRSRRAPFNLKVLLGFVLMAFLYMGYYKYILNSPVSTNSVAIDFVVRNIETNNNISLYDMGNPVAILFYSKPNFFESHLFYSQLTKILPHLEGLDKTGRISLVILVDELADPKQVESIVDNDDLIKNYKKYIYYGDINKIEGEYGVRSTPHFFLINQDKKVMYQDKIPQWFQFMDNLNKIN